MQKFSSQLPKDDLKKFAKEVGKKLVASDFKNNRVEDPTKISEKQEKKVKKYVRDYFEKAVEKKRAIDKKRREKARAQGVNGTTNGNVPRREGDDAELESAKVEESKEDIDIEMSDTEEDKALIASFAQSPSITDSPNQASQDLKRKREGELQDESGDDMESHKRLKESNQEDEVSPPPPPPPPPAGEMPDMAALQEGEDDLLIPEAEEETEEQKELRLQEEELQRENEEALRMDLDGTLKAEERGSKRQDHSTSHVPVGNIVGVPSIVLNAEDGGAEEGMKVEHERKGVLSH
jgi:hypothetical protein